MLSVVYIHLTSEGKFYFKVYFYHIALYNLLFNENNANGFWQCLYTYDSSILNYLWVI